MGSVTPSSEFTAVSEFNFVIIFPLVGVRIAYVTYVSEL